MADFPGTPSNDDFDGTPLADSMSGEGGDDTLFGDAGEDELNGGEGADDLDGGLDADQMFGGLGDDVIHVDNEGDIAIEAGSEGYDSIYSSVSFTMPLNFEYLLLTGSANIDGFANDQGVRITGNSGSNRLVGGTATDELDGGAGADRMEGGLGDETYRVDDIGDRVIELEGEGYDTVYSTISHELAANVEALILDGTDPIDGIGNALNNAITGNDAANRLYGGLGDDRLDGGIGADRMEGNRGDDTYVVDDAGDVVIEQENWGWDRVEASVSYALTAQVEELTLTGTDAIDGLGNGLDNFITGNGAINLLQGAQGNDTLDGGAGDDRMEGGGGDDIYYVDSIKDYAYETEDRGDDLVYSSITYQLTPHVERLTLLGSGNIDGIGNGIDNIITGNDGANRLAGVQGNDTLDGGLGADRLEGGGGDDIYFVDDIGDVVIEQKDRGNDLVYTSIDYLLAAQVEQLTLLGSDDIDGIGNGLDNILTGNAGANRLAGAQGDDTMDGAGGADRMEGGGGNDTYYVDDAGDVVYETEGRGTDLVYSSVTYTLSAHVEGLYLTGSDNIDGIGNGLDNLIMGNDGVNRLVGAQGDDTLDGMAGADRMEGGTGDDLYFVDDAGDVVFEHEGQGLDGIITTVSYTLAANSEVEGVLLFPIGTDNLNLTGNQRMNSLQGNFGDNILDGGAGDDNLDGLFGADTLIGGKGDDWFRVDDAGDTVIEFANEGHDTIYATIDVSLVGTFVEDVVLEGLFDADVVGNGLNNFLFGNDYNNRLFGGDGDDVIDSGYGIDILSGGAGADKFQFTVDIAPCGCDMVHILDFTSGEDQIVLDQYIFDTLDLGTLSEEAFGIGTAATTADQRLLYDPVFGNVYYDADGSDDSYDPILFIQLMPGTTLTFGDFSVIDDPMFPGPPCGCGGPI